MRARSSGDAARVLGVRAYAVKRWHATHSNAAWVAHHEQAALTREHALVTRDIRRRTERAARKIIERGLDDGSFDAIDVKGTTAAVLSMGIDVGRWYRPAAPRALYSPDELGMLYADLVARMVGAPAPGHQRHSAA